MWCLRLCVCASVCLCTCVCTCVCLCVPACLWVCGYATAHMWKTTGRSWFSPHVGSEIKIRSSDSVQSSLPYQLSCCPLISFLIFSLLFYPQSHIRSQWQIIFINIWVKEKQKFVLEHTTDAVGTKSYQWIFILPVPNHHVEIDSEINYWISPNTHCTHLI